MNSPLESTYLNTNGVRLHTILAGPTDGPPVILLHGFPEFWYGWRRQIAPLAAAGYRVVVPDQRGYNLSDKPKGAASYHIETLAGDIVGLLDALGKEKAIVVGHDWGAAVAWQLATTHPERVEKLAILNVPHPAVMVQTLRKRFSQVRKSWYMFFFQIPWLPEWALGRDNARGAAELLRRSGKPDSFTAEDLARYREAWSQPGALTAMINWYRAMVRAGMRQAIKASPVLPRIAVPTLMLWGKQDVALSAEMAQPSIDLCDEGKLVFFENATHWVQHDEAEAVTQALLDFFRDPGRLPQA